MQLNRILILKIFYYSLFILILSLYFSIAVNSLLIPVFVLLFIVAQKKPLLVLKENEMRTSSLLLVILFLSLVISYFYSEDSKQALAELITASPLFFLPLCLTFLFELNSKQLDHLRKFYIIASFLALIYAAFSAANTAGYFDGSYRQLAADRTPLVYFYHHFTYHHLGGKLHAVFFSLYIALAILFTFDRLLKNWSLAYFLALVVFIIFLLFLQSIIIHLALYSFLIGYYYFTTTFTSFRKIVKFLILLMAASLLISYVIILKAIYPLNKGPYLFEDVSLNNNLGLVMGGILLTGGLAVLIKKLIPKYYTIILTGLFILLIVTAFNYYYRSEPVLPARQASATPDNMNARFSFWESSAAVIRQNPFWGIGVGDRKVRVIKSYLDPGSTSTDPDVFNPHNQFLDYWLASGIIPVICLILFLSFEFYVAWKNRHYVYLGLVYCFTLFCFTDVAMTSQRGLVFFLFFSCYFRAEIYKKKLQNEKA